ncbi:Do family serine endopeptidase [Prosthecomicrobium pneumaticum]|uniref:Probable periplasmic serine endoprotease DegP-like n=1 Tax=Prosthecomicrobium pneumaticum TaxID=81895 RepID=A0A7W9FPB1_9HYPH|nr:Do family serine endopeptidase [Prosthecomicrobium pneumaticum]MBB5754392.1 serine protease Do [Prosthecomicrobium pneumaticum]
MSANTENESGRKGSFLAALRRHALLGTALVAIAGGGIAAEAVMTRATPAFAEQVRVENPPAVFSFADVVQQVRGAVVSVRVKSETTETRMSGLDGLPDLPPGSPFERFFREFRDRQGGQGQGQGGETRRVPRIGLGSGFFISEDGYVVTNNHVVDKGTEFVVTTDDGKEHTAKLIGADPKTDLALLKVEPNGTKFKYAAFAQDDAGTRVGDWVVAVGNPFGLGGTVTAGIVSALGREIGSGPYDDYIQIDAAVNQGNSGGPTFNLKGEVIGINTAIYSPSGGNVGIAFDISARTARLVIEQLKEHGEVVRGWLGVQIQPVTADIADSLRLEGTEGALVNEPQADSPAREAGIRAGDVIRSVDGKKVEDARGLAQIIAGYAPGSKVSLDVWRDGKGRQVSVTLGRMPADQRQASADDQDQSDAKPASVADLGIAIAPASDGPGVVVAEVDPDGAAAERGISQGDVILSVGGVDVSRPADVERAIASAKKDGLKAVLMRLKSGDDTRFIAIPFGRA